MAYRLKNIFNQRKLRCSRNYIHINLFVAFALRTILAIWISSIVNSESYAMRKEHQKNPILKITPSNLTDSDEEKFFNDIEEWVKKGHLI